MESRVPSSGTGRVRSVPHPRYTLEQAEHLARKAFAMGARHCDQDAVAQAVDYKNATNGAFKGLRAAANYFGLVSYGSDQFLSVEEDWIDALHADDDEAVRRLRREAVLRPELYRQLVDEFADRQLPSAEKLARQLYLTPKYGILKDAADTAARVFLDSIQFAGIVDANNFLRPRADSTPIPGAGSDAANKFEEPQSSAPPARHSAQPSTVVPTSDESLDKIEVHLLGGRRAYLFVPVPLAPKEKDRLKKYIDLVLEPDETSEVQG